MSFSQKGLSFFATSLLLVFSFQNCSKFQTTDPLVRDGSEMNSGSLQNMSMQLLTTDSSGYSKEESTLLSLSTVRTAGALIMTDAFQMADIGKLESGTTPSYFTLHNPVGDFFGSKKDPGTLNSFISTINQAAGTDAFSKNAYAFPGCSLPSGGNASIYTYSKPYQIYQKELLQWTQGHLGLGDFLPDRARRNTELSTDGLAYKGNKQCPFYQNTPNRDDFIRSMGQAIYFEQDSLTLEMDNQFNPYRWLAPFNPIHHIETPSTAVLLKSSDNAYSVTKDLIRKFQLGTAQEALFLKYDLVLEYDESAGVSEKSFSDLLDSTAKNNFFQSYLDAIEAFIVDANIEAGPKYGASVYKAKRLDPATFQLSLMVNWFENAPFYSLSEFMISSKNYEATTDPTNITRNTKLNPFIPEGGSSGGMSWLRVNVKGLDDYKSNPLFPFSTSVTQFSVQSPSSTRLSGVINLSKYSLLAKQNGFFPIPPDAFDPSNPQHFEHGVKWIGVIFESHGPQRIKLKLNEFRLIKAPLNTRYEDLKTEEGAPLNTLQVPIGTFDALSDESPASFIAQGWAYDGDDPSANLIVEFYGNAPYQKKGSVFLGSTSANLPRSDLVAAGFQGDHAFSFQIPKSFNTAAVTHVYAYARDATSTNAQRYLLNGSPLGEAPVPTPSPCSLGDLELQHGSAITTYQSAIVSYGQVCTSELRTCNDGVLSGTFSSTSCTVAPETSAEREARNLSAYFTQAYQSFFNRDPESEGEKYWIQKYQNGTGLTELTREILMTEESQAKVFSLGNSAFVDRLYSGILGRSPDAPGASYWIQELDSGRRSKVEVYELFLSSGEYKNRLAALSLKL